MQETWVHPWVQSIPGLGIFIGEGNGYLLQYSGLENIMDCIVHGVAKSDFHFHFSLAVKNPPPVQVDAKEKGSIPESERSLKEVMATHSIILAWRIPRTQKSDGLQSIGMQRVRHD